MCFTSKRKLSISFDCVEGIFCVIISFIMITLDRFAGGTWS